MERGWRNPGLMDSQKPNPGRDPNAKSTAGASQNAMEFLKGQSDGEGDDQADGSNDGQEQTGEQVETTEEPASSTPPTSTDPVSPAETEEESTAGASQNALEYLTGESIQTSGSSGNEPDTNQPKDTLTIQDLLNAQGVGDTTISIPDDEKQPDETKADKDGG